MGELSSRQTTSDDENLQRIQVGLSLTSSSIKSTQLFGWGAVIYGVAAKTQLGSPVAADTLSDIISTAIAAKSDLALASLRSVFESADDARNVSLFAAFELQAGSPELPDALIKSKAALAAEALSPSAKPPTTPTTLKPLLDLGNFATLAFAAQLVKYRSLAASSPDLLKQALTRVLSGVGDDYVLLRAVLASLPDVRAAVWPSNDNNHIQFLSVVCRDLNNSRTLFLGPVISKSATALLRERGSDLSFVGLLKDISLSPLSASNLTNGAVVITPQASTITGGNSTVHVAADSVVPIESIVGSGNAAAVGLTKDWLIFKGSTSWAGAAYYPLTSTVAESDTLGVKVSALGIQHKTWRWQGGSGSPRYNIRVGYKPNTDAAWLAVRWRGRTGAVVTVKCNGGVLTPQTLAVEPMTGWSVFAISPNTTAEFEVTFDSAVQDQNGIAKGIWVAAIFEEYIEVLDFDSTTVTAFPDTDLLDLPKATPSNPLLTYVATLQRGTQATGWLLPAIAGATSDSTSAFAMARLALLAAVARASSLVAPGSPLSLAAAPTERQAVLLNSLPVLATRLFAMYEPSVEREMLLLAAAQGKLAGMRDQLGTAMSTLASLTAEQIQKLLNDAASSAQVPPDDTLDKLEQMRVALSGAQETFTAFVTDQQEAIERRCLILHMLQEPRFGPLLPMKTDADVLAQCSE